MIENKLKAKIVENGMTIERVSKEMGINTATFYRKIKKNSFQLREVEQLCQILNISKNEAPEIFFAKTFS